MTTRHGLDAARRQVELLYGDPQADVQLRVLKKGLPALTWEGPFDAAAWKWVESAQEVGYQVYIKPNRGGWKDHEIVSAPAFFIDGDDMPIPDALDWHLTPDFIVFRSATRWQAWWVFDGGEVVEPELRLWRHGQLRLAARYGTDKMVATEATLMRLAGTLNLKDPAHPVPYELMEP